MAQDPEPRDAQASGAVDPSHELDMVPIYTSQNVDAEVEAEVIKGVLVANGMPAIIVRASVYPPLGFEIHVPRALAEEARRLIEEQRKAGPQAAAEGEAASEAPAGEEPE